MVTPLVLNKLFFPNFDPLVGTLLAYTTFFVGFISRPIGGIIFGHYGDRIGRKTVLILTLIIMGIATFLIGLLPTYASVGIWAPIMLLVLRVFQGIGIGGEWGGAVLMAVEHSPAGTARLLRQLAADRRSGRPAAERRHGLRALLSAGSRLSCLGLAHRVPDQRGAGRGRSLYPA